MEPRHDLLPLVLGRCPVISCDRFGAKPVAQGSGYLLNVVCIRRPNDCLALNLVHDIQQLAHAVVGHGLYLSVVWLQKTAANLLQAHDLRQNALCGGQLSIFHFGEGQLLHLLVKLFLFRRKRYIAANVDFGRKIQAILFQDAVAKRVQLRIQLIQAAVARDLLKAAMAHRPALYDGITGLKGKEAVEPQRTVIQ